MLKVKMKTSNYFSIASNMRTSISYKNYNSTSFIFVFPTQFLKRKLNNIKKRKVFHILKEKQRSNKLLKSSSFVEDR